jgi:hypothetical protein
MECAFVFLTLLVACALLMAAAAGQRNNDWRRANEALRGVAMMRHGRFLRGGWLQVPKVCFRRHGVWFIVSVHRESRRWEVQVRTTLHGHKLACEALTSRNGNRDLSRPYYFLQSAAGPLYVWANDLDGARQLLSDGVRMQFDRLRAAADTPDAKLSLHEGRLAIVKPVRRVTGESVHEVVALALELYEQAQVALTIGIEFAGKRANFSLDEAVCKVCGEELSGAVVVCRVCKTPHHQDCWLFIGECSVFGCGCDQCESLPSAPHAAPTTARRAAQAPKGEVRAAPPRRLPR